MPWRIQFIVCIGHGSENNLCKSDSSLKFLKMVSTTLRLISKHDCFLLLLKNIYFLSVYLFGASQVVPVVKNPPTNAGDTRDVGSILGSERSLEVGNGTPLQYPCLENSMGRGAWQATVHGVPKSRTWQCVWAHAHMRARVHTHTHTHIYLFGCTRS